MIFESFSSANYTVLTGVFLASIVLGAVVNKTNFCTMGAVSDLVNMNDLGRMRAWLLAIAVSLIGVIIMESSGMVDFDATRPPFRTSNFAWLEYLLGGFIFGIGMTLGSGCGNKTLVRIGAGNLKSVIVFIPLAICAYFMMNPFPGTDKTLYSELFYYWTNPLTVSMDTQQDLGSLFSSLLGTDVSATRTWTGIIIAVLLLIAIFRCCDFRKSFDNILAGTIIGIAVVAAWYITGNFATISMEGETYSWVEFASTDVWSMMADGKQPRAVAVQSFTFINPAGETLGFILNKFNSYYLTFGVVVVFGVMAGSFLWAILTGTLRVEWFTSFKDFINHVIGGALMGIGGVLALGCTLGQGVTGASTLALGSFITLISIILGCATTMKVQYYKLMYEDEATFIKVLLSILVDFHLLPKGLRKLDRI